MDFNRGFLKLDNALTDSYYYRYVLDDTDKNLLQCLWKNVSIGSSKYFNNGLLVANIKEKTLLEKSGLSYPTLLRHIKRLDSLGVIIKKRRKVKHNRYLVGFRTQGNERLYLLEHLIKEYDNFLERTITSQIKKFEKKWQTPSIKDVSAFAIDSNYKDYVVDHLDNPKELTHKRFANGKTIFEVLFNRTDIYRPPLPKLRDLSFKGSK